MSVETLTPSVSVHQSSLPRDTAAQFPWPSQTPGEFTYWDELARYPNFWEGHIVCGLLISEGVTAAVRNTWPGPDLASHSVVWVPRELMRRAHWILAWPAPSESELIFLATGDLEPGP